MNLHLRKCIPKQSRFFGFLRCIAIFKPALVFSMLFIKNISASVEIPRPIFYIDHVTITVRDLNPAIKDFQTLGFSVIPGGKFSDKETQNAHIPFKDGTYIELFSMVDPKGMGELESLKNSDKLRTVMLKENVVQRRSVRHIALGEGLSDFALSADSLDWNATLPWLRSLGVQFADPIEMYRIQPDGKKIVWKIAMPSSDALPFLIQDVTPQALRKNVGAIEREQKQLGVTGIAGITVVVTDLPQQIKQYESLLGVKPNFDSCYPLPNARTVDFNLENTVITLASPIKKSGELYQYLLTRGEGPYLLRLYTDKDLKGILDLNLSHGVIIEIF